MIHGVCREMGGQGDLPAQPGRQPEHPALLPARFVEPSQPQFRPGPAEFYRGQDLQASDRRHRQRGVVFRFFRVNQPVESCEVDFFQQCGVLLRFPVRKFREAARMPALPLRFQRCRIIRLRQGVKEFFPVSGIRIAAGEAEFLQRFHGQRLAESLFQLCARLRQPTFGGVREDERNQVGRQNCAPEEPGADSENPPEGDPAKFGKQFRPEQIPRGEQRQSEKGAFCTDRQDRKRRKVSLQRIRKQERRKEAVGKQCRSGQKQRRGEPDADHRTSGGFPGRRQRQQPAEKENPDHRQRQRPSRQHGRRNGKDERDRHCRPGPVTLPAVGKTAVAEAVCEEQQPETGTRQQNPENHNRKCPGGPAGFPRALQQQRNGSGQIAGRRRKRQGEQRI